MIVGSNILAGASGQQGYFLNRSVRLRSSASAYFNRTPSSTSNQSIWTYSSWLKRGILNVTPFLLSAADASGSTNYDAIDLSGDTLRIYFNGGTSAYLQTTSVYRDPSSWYHIVISVDTTQATSSNRIKVYINGIQVTAFSSATYPTQNYASFFNLSGRKNTIGANALTTPANFLDGYFTEINFIDGQALTPTSFGEYNTITGVWQPKKYGGTYGTNGFYLNFNDNSAATAAAIGKDSSGNGNNWTPNNISVTAGTTYDSMTDVPTLTSATQANYAVFNPLDLYAGSIPANGNLSVTSTISGGYGTIAVSSGKWYWETLSTTALTNRGVVGVRSVGGTDYYATYWSDGQKNIDGTVTAYGASYTTNDIIGVALDLDGGTITFYKNGTSQGVISYSRSGSLFRSFNGVVSGGTTESWWINFGQRPFTYTPPTGFNRLNTYNLPTPTIKNGAAQMAATLWTGTGSTALVTNAVNGVSFQPDLVWTKARSAAYDNQLTDSVRGANKELQSNGTAVESNFGTVTAFNSNGFTVGTGASSNQNGVTYVDWNWKAGGTAVTNTAGSISSQVSANPSAGFSIVTYTGNNSSGSTVGHGLGVAPKMIIIKSRSRTTDWLVWHTNLSSQQILVLNSTAAAATGTNGYVGTVSSINFQISGINTNDNINFLSATYVAYCFSEIAGYSKIGSYTGNGSNDGPFVYTGFRPRFILFRPISAGNWFIRDTSRDTYNTGTLSLYPNLSDAEFSGVALDILSNGFKIRSSGSGINGSGENIIYAAFAENPFNYSLAR